MVYKLYFESFNLKCFKPIMFTIFLLLKKVSVVVILDPQLVVLRQQTASRSILEVYLIFKLFEYLEFEIPYREP